MYVYTKYGEQCAPEPKQHITASFISCHSYHYHCVQWI